MSLLFKTAKAEVSYAMTGRLYITDGNWLYLSVPNALVRGVFDSMTEPGIELPPDMGSRLNAHISVMSDDEVAEIGGASKITERGHTFKYTPGKLRSFNPKGWDEMSKCWALDVKSPELEKLRKSYGLPKTPQRGDEDIPFHITVAVRRKRVLQPNDVSKAAFWLSIDTAFPK